MHLRNRIQNRAMLDEGIRLAEQGQHKAAINHLLKAYDSLQKETPVDTSSIATAAYFLGTSYLGVNDADLAKDYLTKAFHAYIELSEHNPEYHSAFINCTLDLAQCCIDSGMPGLAFTHLKSLQAGILSGLSRTEDDELNAAISDIYLLLADVSDENVPTREEYLSRSLQFNPDNISSSIKLAIICFSQNKTEKAADILRTLYSTTDWDSQDPVLQADCLYHLGRCELKLGAHAKAKESLARALDTYQQLDNVISISATQLGLGLTCYHLGHNKAGNHHLHDALSFFQHLDNADDVEKANDIILDWCDLANFPGSFRINGAQQTILARLLVRIINTGNQPSVTEVMSTLFNSANQVCTSPVSDHSVTAGALESDNVRLSRL
jgi:tetratricopeptide (TPR) repeat protein